MNCKNLSGQMPFKSETGSTMQVATDKQWQIELKPQPPLALAVPEGSIPQIQSLARGKQRYVGLSDQNSERLLTSAFRKRQTASLRRSSSTLGLRRVVSFAPSYNSPAQP